MHKFLWRYLCNVSTKITIILKKKCKSPLYSVNLRENSIWNSLYPNIIQCIMSLFSLTSLFVILHCYKFTVQRIKEGKDIWPITPAAGVPWWTRRTREAPALKWWLFYLWWLFRKKLVYKVPWGARLEIIWCLHKKLVAGHHFLAPASNLVAGVAWWKAIIQKFSRALNNHLALYWNISIVKYKTYFHL
jgi:hypothetical protein